MRIVREIPGYDCRTTIFHWNNKYIIKLETPELEQTFKIDQYEVTSDEQVVQMLDDSFMKLAMKRFEDMSRDFAEATKRME